MSKRKVTEHPLNGKSSDIPTDVWQVENLDTGDSILVLGAENRDEAFRYMRIFGTCISTRIAIADNYTMCVG